MRSIGVVFAILLSAVTIIGLASPLHSLNANNVRGALISVQTVSIPDDAIAYIKLVDVSPRQNIEMSTIARQVIYSPGSLPVAFELQYDPEMICTHHLYAIQAQITTAGRVFLSNQSANLVITQGYPSVVEVVLAPYL